MKTFEIYWDDLTEEAQTRMQEMYHENIGMLPIAIVDIEDEEEDDNDYWRKR